MIVIFVSGTIGSGKSQFCRFLAELGAEYVSADQIVSELYSDDAWCRSLEAYLNRSFRKVDGEFNKAALATIAFSDPHLRQSLENFIHPQVRAELQKIIARSSSNVFVYEIPILRDNTDTSLADFVVKIESVFELRLARLISRGMTEADARARIKVQDEDAQRDVGFDTVVTNDGSVDQLQEQALRLFRLWSTE